MGVGWLECGQPTRGHTVFEKWLLLLKASCQYVLSGGWSSWATLPHATVWLAWPCACLVQAAMTDVGLWVHWPWNVPEPLICCHPLGCLALTIFSPSATRIVPESLRRGCDTDIWFVPEHSRNVVSLCLVYLWPDNIFPDEDWGLHASMGAEIGV